MMMMMIKQKPKVVAVLFNNRQT